MYRYIYRLKGLGFGGYIKPPKMENQMQKNMDNEMETAL